MRENWINIFRSGHTGVWLGPEVEIWGHSFSAVVGVSGDVSNVFRVPLTLWKVSGDSGMLMHLSG